MRFIAITLLFALSLVKASGQGFTLRGIVTEEGKGSSLAFVSVGLEGEAQGTSTDIDGRFKLPVTKLPATLVFTYVGYEFKKVTINTGDEAKLITIALKKKNFELREVVIKAGPNPAIPIIKKAVANRDRNDPEKLSSYTYTSYNKLILTANSDSLKNIKVDTSREKMIKFFERSHLFLLETVTDKKFMAPNMTNEYIKGIRASGFKDPSFIALATQLQSFSFYKELIELADKTYLNPISKNSENKYLFVLEDTLYEGVDSVFVISFSPRTGRNFDGMVGILYINTNGYAIENVIAKPNEEDNFGVKIQQKYEVIDGRWFPVQLNTDLQFKNAQINAVDIIGIGRTYLTDIKVNPPLKRSQFTQIDLTMEPRAAEQEDPFWASHRPDSLDRKERNTYEVIDSIGKATNFDKKIRAFIALSNGKIPIKSIDLEIDKILRYNLYEGFRVGMGFHTNSRFSQVVKMGGYVGYGFKDKGFKWGADASVRIIKNADFRVKAIWMSDVLESGQPEIRGTPQVLYNERVRNAKVSNMDFLNKGEVNVSFRTPGYLRFVVFGNNTNASAKYSYHYTTNPINDAVGDSVYNLTEAGVSVRFAYKEKLFDTGKVLASLGTNSPIIFVQYTRGLTGLLNGEYAYNKIDVKIDKSFSIKGIGKPAVCVWAGYVDRPVPYILNYAGRADYTKKGYVASLYSFETMRMNEFLSDKYVSIFFRHNFQTLLFKAKKFKPTFEFITNAGWGTLSHPERHVSPYFLPKTMEKVFLESGLEINDLLRRQGLFGLGIGGYYRYGAYSLHSFKDNISVKLSLNLNL